MPHRPSDMEKLKRLKFDLRRRERRLTLLCVKWAAAGLVVGFLLRHYGPLLIHPP